MPVTTVTVPIPIVYEPLRPLATEPVWQERQHRTAGASERRPHDDGGFTEFVGCDVVQKADEDLFPERDLPR